jgi:hypothetical protein
MHVALAARARASLVVLAAAFAACGGSSPSRSPADGSTADGPVDGSTAGPLAGKIGGKPWTFVAGETNPARSPQPGVLRVNLWDKMPSAPCLHVNPGGSTDRVVFLDIFPIVGDVESTRGDSFGYDAPVDEGGTVVDEYFNDPATAGSLEVTSLTSASLTGHLEMSSGASSIAGDFQIVVCAQ